MLLVEVTINETLYRVSMEGIPLTHYWDNQIVGFDPLSHQLATLYGGYVRPGYGGVYFNYDLFSIAGWPPPFDVTIAAYYTATTEEAKELLFTGNGHLASITRESVKYDLYSASYATTIADLTEFDDTLDNVVDWFCDAARLNLTVDHTYDRVVSPPVKFTSSGEQIAINLLSEICAFNSHLFYIYDSTLYLIDMLRDAGSETITEFDFFPSEYYFQVPVAIAKTTNFARTSIYPYGSALSMGTEYVDTEDDINKALDNIIEILNRGGCRLKMPFLGSIPTPGKKISWTDTSLGIDLAAWIRARTIIYDFQNEEIIIEGEGILSGDIIPETALVIIDESDEECVVNDDFTGQSGNPPNATKWEEQDPHNVMALQNNTLEFWSYQPATDQQATIASKWLIPAGDFDIQISFDTPLLPDPIFSRNVAPCLRVHNADLTKYAEVGRSHNGALSTGEDGYFTQGTSDNLAKVGDFTQRPGKLRLTRVGSSIRAYWWREEGPGCPRWEYNGVGGGFLFITSWEGPTYVYIWFKVESGSAVRAYVDDFFITEGCPE